MPTQTVCRLLLGNELRRAREKLGRTPAEAADVIGNKATKISRIELGQSGLGKGDLTLLLDYYDIDPDRREVLFELARNSRERGRWSGYREVFPEWFRMFVDLEQDAEQIRSTNVEVMPGLLQTEAYVRALQSELDRDEHTRDIEHGVRARKERQRIFTKDDPPEFGFILSESCLRRVVGGPAVMRDQLVHLQKLSRKRNIQIQVLPFDAPTYVGRVAYRFTLLQIPSPGTASPLEFAYVESYDDARYIDDKQAVRNYVGLWNRLQAAALGPVESRRLIGEVAEQFAQAV
ncbi:MAG TPA: helix-turn-helix transcriptional regulator [Actinophytocola sp.]|jgi:transcriptional regulator with XRE-family HTH domain|uniref:helix-turn-helix domain-containing protein n=1 Tax=Actinophytocola sp. TaxID=1872138 RepID=UPI002E0C7EA3|nr:helix-turn-helix transcriptional regulator [Actinophytocola sp.]